ncbi:MAG: amidohydrolase family protein [Acidimicrobiia bacterium]|nr:MAG: amidohydrolase family protein [Acidimicrobiia bacterium]
MPTASRGRLWYQHQVSIDIHAHCVPAEAVDLLRRDGTSLGIEVDDDGKATVAGRPLPMTLRPALSDRDARLAAMDRSGVERQVLSPWIDFTAYRLDPDRGARWSRRLNETLAAEAASHPDRFLAVGTVPLQTPESAVVELRHAVEELGMAGVEIGTRVGDVYLANADLDPFWAEAARLRCLVVLHPLDPLPGIDLSSHFLHNIVGRPAESTIAIAGLILDGLLDRHPELVLCIVHGGGFLPYQIGRMNRGWEVRPEIVATDLSTPPIEVLRTLYFDTVLHEPAAIRSLVDLVGADHVLLGTDYPFEMGDLDPIGTIGAVPGLSAAERHAIVSGNVERLLSEIR